MKDSSDREYTIKYRRHNKEKYWYVRKTVSLFGFQQFMREVTDNVEIDRIEIVIEKVQFNPASKQSFPSTVQNTLLNTPKS